MSSKNLKRSALIAFIITVVSLAIATAIGFTTGIFQKSASKNLRLHENTHISPNNIDEKKSAPIAKTNLITVKTISEGVKIHDRPGKSLAVWLHGTTSSKDEKDKPQLKVVRNNGTIEIYVERKRSSTFGISIYNAALDITLPQGYAGKLSAESVSGNIDLGSHDYDGVTLKTTSGSIHIENMNTPEFNSETVSGSLYAKALLTRRSEISSTSGGINISAFTGDADIHSVSGVIGVSYTTVPGSLMADTTSGNIIIELPNFAKFQLDASSTSGDVMCAFPITVTSPRSNSGNHSIVGTVSNGKGQIRLHSVSGGIAVNRGE